VYYYCTFIQISIANHCTLFYTRLAMNHLDYEVTLQNAKAQLLSVQNRIGENQNERDALEKELVTVRSIIVSLSSMLGREFNEDDELGLTDAVRQAFRTAGRHLLATDVKDRMESLGYNTAKYGNAMSAVHTVIARLIKQGQVRQLPNLINNKPAYEWIQSMTPPPTPLRPTSLTPPPVPSLGGGLKIPK
jgi:hypothetical protein